VGCGSGSSLSAKKKGGKDEGPLFGSSPIGVSSLVVKKDGNEVLGLKVSSPSSDGAWAIVGGALPSFAELVRSKGLVKFQFPLVERRAKFLSAVRPTALKEVTMIPLDCSMLEKELQGKDLPLNLQGKGRSTRLLSTQGKPSVARKTVPRLNLRTWNFLVKLLSRVFGSLMRHSYAFRLGLKPNFSFKGLRLGRVLTKPKSKKGVEVMGLGLPLDPEASFKCSLGFGSTVNLQRPEATTTIDIGGGLSAPTSPERSKGAKLLKGAGSTSLATDLCLPRDLQNGR
jgi:hypothetical protein